MPTSLVTLSRRVDRQQNKEMGGGGGEERIVIYESES